MKLLLEATEDKAPGATKVIWKELSIIDERVKEILSEIQGKSKALCKQTQGTSYEDLGIRVNEAGEALLRVRDPIALEKQLIYFEAALNDICNRISEERGEACRLLEIVKEEYYIEDKLPGILMILSKIHSQIIMKDKIETFEKKLDEIMVSFQPGIREKFIISTGVEFAGTGAKHEIHIPLQRSLIRS